MLMHSTQFPPPVVPGAEYYRFRRDDAGQRVLATLSGRPPKDVKRSGASYEDVVKADRAGFTGIAACKSNGDIEYWEYPTAAVLRAVKAKPAQPQPVAQPTVLASAADTGDGWHTHRVVVCDGNFDTHIDAGDDYQTLTLREVFDAKPANQDKTHAPAMIPSSYSRFDARNHEAQRQHGSYVALAGDIDQGNVPMDTVQAHVRAFVGDAVAFLIYSSSSATAEKRKWRIVVPLAQAHAFAAWQELQGAFFTFMAAQGVAVDWALARAGQLVYLPNVPTNKRDWRGAPLFYERDCIEGRGLSPADDTVAKALADLRAVRSRDEAERQQAKQAAKQAMQACGMTTKSAVIDPFNQTYSVEMMLEATGYERGPGDSWRSRYQESTTFATKNFGDYWVSMSASDAGAGLGAECVAGRFGDAFDLYCHFDHGGDFKKAVRGAAKMLGLDKQPATATPVDVSGITGQGPGLRPTSKQSVGAVAAAQEQQDGPAPEGNADADAVLSGETPQQTVYDQAFVAEYLAKKAKETKHPINPVNLEACVVNLDELVNPDSIHPHVIEKLVPQGEVTLLAGHGAAGKSFIALLACVLVALGRPFGKLVTTRTRVLFFSAEDDKAELQRRVARICRHLDIQQSELKGWLFLIDVSEIDPTLFRAAETDPDDQPTRLLKNLATFVQTHDIGMSVIDNASDVFDGNEIVRPEVRAFIRNLRGKLARPHRAVILLAHVSKAAAHNRRTPGASTDEDYSGSTAWHNSVRSRLSLDTDDKSGSTLKHLKANKGPKADPINLEWHDGAPTVSGMYEAPGAGLIASLRKSAETVRDETDKAAIISIIQGFDWRRERVPTAMQGPYSVHRTLKDLPNFPVGLTSDRLNRLVRELEHEGKLYRVTQRTKDRKDVSCFTCSPDSLQRAPIPRLPTAKGEA